MKQYLTGAFCTAIAGAALALSLGINPAQAQRGGSFLRTCTNVRAYGDRIIADCRREDGDWNRTALRDVDSCVGDIANMDGNLTCSRGREGWRRDEYRGWGNYGSSGWDRDYYQNRYYYRPYYQR